MGLTARYSDWQVGGEYRARAVLVVELKSRAKQTLAQFELEANSTSLFNVQEARQSAEQQLLLQLGQIDVVDKLVEAGNK